MSENTELSKEESVLLARLDERTRYLVEGLPQMKTDLNNSINEVKSALHETRNTMQNIKESYVSKSEFDPLKETLRKDYVQKNEFWPVKTLVYGFVGIVLLAVISALVYLVIKY